MDAPFPLDPLEDLDSLHEVEQYGLPTASTGSLPALSAASASSHSSDMDTDSPAPSSTGGHGMDVGLGMDTAGGHGSVGVLGLGLGTERVDVPALAIKQEKNQHEWERRDVLAAPFSYQPPGGGHLSGSVSPAFFPVPDNAFNNIPAQFYAPRSLPNTPMGLPHHPFFTPAVAPMQAIQGLTAVTGSTNGSGPAHDAASHSASLQQGHANAAFSPEPKKRKSEDTQKKGKKRSSSTSAVQAPFTPFTEAADPSHAADTNDAASTVADQNDAGDFDDDFDASLTDGGEPPKKKSFKPWNTSPASSHLPSGSACINPVTGEVELPDLANLTKEEIRKVKNRASAQRSRTRKSEQAVTLKEENAKLRSEIEVLRAQIEGRTADPEAMEAIRPAGQADEERRAMKAMIESLRAEVIKERQGRETAESELKAYRERLPGMSVNTAASNAHDALASGRASRQASESPQLRAVDLTEDVEILPPAKRKQKDSKGMLMMMVLLSFAIFSVPPHLRNHSSYSTAFHVPISDSEASLTRLLPFDQLNLNEGDEEKDSMRATKSVSFTLLRPLKDNEQDDHHTDVEGILERWLGLSLNDRKQETPIPGGWVVVDPPDERTLPSTPTWHGGEIEPMNLDTELLSISTMFDDERTPTMPFAPDQKHFGPSPTLAPQTLDPLEDHHHGADSSARDARSSSVPLFASQPSTSRRRQSVSGPLPTAEPVSLPANRYVKLDLEVDFEVEFTCKGLRRKTTPIKDSVLDREEAGRLLKGNVLSIGEGASSGFAVV